MTSKENYLRAVRFERPDYIPMNVWVQDACYFHYPQEELFDLMESHKFLFPDFVRPKTPYVPKLRNCDRKDHPYTDDFGCVWETAMDGITGTVTKHPLESWDNFPSYRLPDPDKCMGIGSVDWDKLAAEAKSTPDELHIGGLRHGHTFLQLCDIRGYENLLYDMYDEEPLLWELIDMVESFNMEIVRHYIDMDYDVISYAEDLGMQQGPMLSPDFFRKYIKPSYTRLMKPAKDAGKIIHMHSDGDIRTLVDDMLDSGIDIINLQDLVNGIDWIKDNLAGKHCIDLDIDRQSVTTFGTPEDIENLIRKEVTTLGSKQGGLTCVFGLYPGVPLKNISALFDAMEKYMFYFD